MRTAGIPWTSQCRIIDWLTGADSVLTSFQTSRSDPRVMAGLIADTSLRFVERKRVPASRRVFEATLLRLLETYRYDTFRQVKHRSILARTASRPSEREPAEDLSAEVREAIQATHRAMFPNVDREKFCDTMAIAVRAFFGTQELVTGEHVNLLRRFLTLLRDNLAK